MVNGLVIRPFAENVSVFSDYCLHAEQAIFTSLPMVIIETFQKDSYNQPFVISFDDQLIGCFALYTNRTGNIYTSNEYAIIFKSFSIDSRFQKRGHALHTLGMLPETVKQLYPDKNEIILTVHHTNIPAIQLYNKAGFINKGQIFKGVYGEELVFHYDLV